MTYLFDTNAWLRASQEPELLSPAARRAIVGATEVFGLSTISVWEVCLKVRRRKLNLFAPLDAWCRITLRPAFVRLFPLDAGIARLSQELPGTFHEDPADRFIVATAIRHDLTLITSDELILAYPHVRALW